MADITIPARIDREMFEGATGTIIFRIPAYYSMTGKYGRFQIREKSGRLIVNKYKDNGTEVDGNDIGVTFDITDTTAKAGVYEYGITAYDDAGLNDHIIVGNWTINRQISKT
jgi:hypothetical protein